MRFYNILLLVDTETTHEAVLDQATTLAQTNQAKLTLCATVDTIPETSHKLFSATKFTELLGGLVSEKREQLDALMANVSVQGLSVDTKVLVGKPHIEVIKQVLASGYDLVIKSADKTANVRDVLFGSTDMNLMRSCPCPVWISKPAATPHKRRILAAVDQDPDSADKDVLNNQILDLATSLALANFAELHIVHAWHMYGEALMRSPRSGLTEAEVEAMLDTEAIERRRWLENLVGNHNNGVPNEALDYLSPTLHPIEGSARRVVPVLAKTLDVDLIVMGTVARTGIPGFIMGNTSESILGQIDCSVLTVKPPGFSSPVV